MLPRGFGPLAVFRLYLSAVDWAARRVDRWQGQARMWVCAYAGMDGWPDGRIGGWLAGWLGGIDGWRDGWMGVSMYRCIDICMHGWKDQWMRTCIRMSA